VLYVSPFQKILQNNGIMTEESGNVTPKNREPAITVFGEPRNSST
jgi:hypothetical protein